MLLEGLATAHGVVDPAPDVHLADDMTLDPLPLLGRLADTSDAGFGAALFHSTLAHALAEWVATAAGRTGIADVVLSGGCFMNRLLAHGVERRLEERGLAVHEACELPPNDGGISAGQAWVALMSGRE
jgi:hydrogenase maturation protein HypF